MNTFDFFSPPHKLDALFLIKIRIVYDDRL